VHEIEEPAHLGAAGRSVRIDIADDRRASGEKSGSYCAAFADRVIDVEQPEVRSPESGTISDRLRVVRATVEDEQDFGVLESVEILYDGLPDPRTFVVSRDDERKPRRIDAVILRRSQN